MWKCYNEDMNISTRIESALNAAPVELDVIFYNLDNSRPDAQVSKELHAFAASNPDIIGICEAIGNRLPPLPGYQLIKSDDNSGSARSRSRKNNAAYVKKGIKVSRVGWIDCYKTWPRTQGKGGIHEARSYLKFRADGVVIIVAHQPQRPLGDDKLRAALFAARAEGMGKLAAAMSFKKGVAPRAVFSQLRPRILMSDFNARVGEPQGPHILAKAIGGVVYNGDRIDNFVVRGGVKLVGKVDVFSSIKGVKLESDHHHAIRATFKTSKFWLRGKKNLTRNK